MSRYLTKVSGSWVQILESEPPPPPIQLLSLPGITGNYASTPDHANNSPTNYLDLRIKFTVLAEPAMGWAWYLAVKKYLTDVPIYGINIYDKNPRFETRVGGTGVSTAQGIALPGGWVIGSTHWLRGEFSNPDDTTKLFHSTDGAAWTLLSSATYASVSGIDGGTGPLRLGAYIDGSLATHAKIHRLELRTVSGGLPVQIFDAEAVTKIGTRNPSSVVSSTGETWTINGSAWDWVEA